MGRRKLYHTPEEKAVANRNKSKRYYERHKSGINRKRRSIYKRAAEKKGSVNNVHTQENRQPSEEAVDPISSWMERSERVQKRLERITHGSASEFVDNLCQMLLRDGDKDRVHMFSVQFGELRKSVYQYQHEILQLEGWGENYKKLEGIIKEIHTVLNWVDELMVLAMVDLLEVQQLYDKSELLYQKK